jgi:hypothetical protein
LGVFAKGTAYNTKSSIFQASCMCGLRGDDILYNASGFKKLNSKQPARFLSHMTDKAKEQERQYLAQNMICMKSVPNAIPKRHPNLTIDAVEWPRNIKAGCLYNPIKWG